MTSILTTHNKECCVCLEECTPLLLFVGHKASKTAETTSKNEPLCLIQFAAQETNDTSEDNTVHAAICQNCIAKPDQKPLKACPLCQATFCNPITEEALDKLIRNWQNALLFEHTAWGSKQIAFVCKKLPIFGPRLLECIQESYARHPRARTLIIIALYVSFIALTYLTCLIVGATLHNVIIPAAILAHNAYIKA